MRCNQHSFLKVGNRRSFNWSLFSHHGKLAVFCQWNLRFQKMWWCKGNLGDVWCWHQEMLWKWKLDRHISLHTVHNLHGLCRLDPLWTTDPELGHSKCVQSPTPQYCQCCQCCPSLTTSCKCTTIKGHKAESEGWCVTVMENKTTHCRSHSSWVQEKQSS